MIDRKISKKISTSSNLTVMGQAFEGDNKASGESLKSSSRNASNMQMKSSEDRVS